MLKIENVEKHYGTFHLECSLEVKPGYITGLIGKNGAGKTTTFKAILGLIRTDGGRITILGKETEDLTASDREQTGVVLSDSGFSGYLTVKDLTAVLAGMYRKFDEEMFVRRCKEFGLPMDKKIKEFSTGMKRKLQVLAALSHHAKLLIMDEPTAGMDVIAREEVLDLLREYMEEQECAILISSHISGDLEGLCDDIYMIDDGKIVLHEDTDVLIENYGLLKVTEDQYDLLDQAYILRKKEESYGYSCLTDQKQFYVENYPEIAVEKGSIDEVMMMMIRGEEI